jgi:hypothetical protein
MEPIEQFSGVLLEKPAVAQPLKNFPAFLRNLKVYFNIHRNFPLVSILSKTNTVRTPLYCFSKFRFTIILKL